MRLLYLKYILEQNEHSLLQKCFKLQLEQPSKNDWASTCVEDLKKLQIDNTFEEIKVISKNKFKNLVPRIQKSRFLLTSDHITTPTLKLRHF